ncbi:MAG: SDR family oxidoreductase [Candidatus Omnitrophica bacterium]|nr:SDR family oxidoreductase [Candidatus Omnitrophota bacterium]
MNAFRKKFESKIVVVTGASAGLGKAIALGFAQQGAHVVILARNQARLEKVKKEIETYDVKCMSLALDVSNSAMMDSAAEQIEREMGPIDIWVNNAMVSVFSPIKEMLAEEYQRVTEVTYLGVVYGTLAALRHMRKRDQGIIIQIGSVLAYRGIPLQSAYSAAKHAVEGFQDALQSELRHEESHIQACMIQMPALNTPQFDWTQSRLPRKAQPVPPIFQPEVGVEAVLWAAQHPRRELNVSFRASLFIWGNKFFPAWGDQYLAKNGYQSQQTEEMEDPNRPSNLWKSVEGDFDRHGRFDLQSIEKSCFLWLQTRLRMLWVFLFIFVLIFLLTLILF